MSSTQNATPTTLGGYLLHRLHTLGLRHIFGIPGDYVLGLYRLIEESPIERIGTTREDCAGFAADAYARINGIGAACVTYCVGGLNTVNAIACAYAERSPVVLLSGSPGLNERLNDPMLHHMVRDFHTQQEVFEKITVAAVILDDPQTAPRLIDHALAQLQRYKRPIYLEIPRDLVFAPVTAPASPAYEARLQSDPEALKEALEEACSMLAEATNPVLLAGAELHRFGLQEVFTQLAERLNIPIAATLLGKSVIKEDHPLYMGIYGGLVGRDAVNRYVETSDCCLMLGTVLSDMDMDGPSTAISVAKTVHATADRIAIKRHHYAGVYFEDFVRALANSALPAINRRFTPCIERPASEPPALDTPVALEGMFAYIDTILAENAIVIADVGEALFASADLHVRNTADFLSPAYYTSMGFAVPAAVGAGFANPALRPLVLVGDGAFQMTGTELSTAVYYKQAPIVVVLNNQGYSTEREIMEGAFNDIAGWRYEKICDLIGGGKGYRVRTQGEFIEAMTSALNDTTQPHVLNVLLDPADRSSGMKRLASRLAKRLALS